MEARLREIIISVTNRCNLRCAMCQIPEMQGNGEMTTEDLKALINDAVNLCPNSVVFSGGEPLLREDIFELISFASRLKINTCLTSNGILLDSETARRLHYSGIDVVNISVEGPQHIHDSLRGKGSFMKAIQALRDLLQYKIEATVATIVCRQNYKYLPYVMDLARQLGVTTVKFQPFSEIFLVEKEAGKGFFVLPKESGEVRSSIEMAIQLAKNYKIATNPDNYLFSIPSYLSGRRQSYRRNSCPALWYSCPIDSSGGVCLCWVLSERLLGNVKKARLSEIWNSYEHNRLRRQVIEEGCPGCLMSCYDYNLGGYGFKHLISLKARKLKKPKFYRRLYNRIYQNLRHISGKVIIRISESIFFRKTDKPDIAYLLKEIKSAKDKLRRELKDFK